MQIQLCKKGLTRLGDGADPLLSALREREHTPVVKDCLVRCGGCDAGLIVAIADGIPLAAKRSDKLLADLDTLAADDG